ncbi:hypothetical protein MFLAVUS_010958 [Mucor flavus]|uniref:Uncharacterized protein n=1 Tax=Mucor flavus TaxID=439312 RepID=A0ABP9ZE70_9FUNG
MPADSLKERRVANLIDVHRGAYKLRPVLTNGLSGNKRALKNIGYYVQDIASLLVKRDGDGGNNVNIGYPESITEPLWDVVIPDNNSDIDISIF